MAKRTPPAQKSPKSSMPIEATASDVAACPPAALPAQPPASEIVDHEASLEKERGGNDMEVSTLEATLEETAVTLNEALQRNKELESQLKVALAEVKIFKEANASEADKSALMALRLDKEIHELKAVEAWRAQVRKFIAAIDDLHWARARAPICLDADSIPGVVTEWLIKYEGAIEPLIRLTRI